VVVFVPLAHPTARLEAITGRLFPLSGGAHKTKHIGQQHLNITQLYGKNKQARVMLARDSALL